MKILTATGLLILFTVFIYSCQQPAPAIDYAGFVSHEFRLTGLENGNGKPDTIAKILVKIPARLDTFHRWHANGDCATCGQIKYRFSDKHYSQLEESDASLQASADSVYQLTFFHNPIITKKKRKLDPIKAGDTTNLSNYLANFSTVCDEFHIISRQYTTINNRPFILCTFDSRCSALLPGKPTLMVGAITSLKNTSLLILAETNASDTSGFVGLIEKTIRSMEIIEP